MSSTENNTQRARRDEQRTRFLSRENIVKMIKTTVVLSALFLSIWAVVLNQAIEPLDINTDEESSILVKTEGREADVYCPEGGADIFLGTDFDGNGQLSIDEITTSTKVCHGQQGLSGPQGQSGVNGNDGMDGNYGRLVATSNHLLFVADDGTHGHELHQYLRSSIRDQWMVWD